MKHSPLRRNAGLFAAALSIVGPAAAASAQQSAPTPAQKPTAAAVPTARPAAAPARPAVKLPANVAAQVDGRNITRDEVLAVFDMVGGRPIIGQMVQALALENEAKRRGITVTTAELNKAVQEMKDRFVQSSMQNGGRPMEFKELATQYGITEEYVRYSAHLDLLRRKAFTKAMEAQMPPLTNQVKLAHILVATVPLGQPPEQPAAETDPAKRDAEAKTKIEKLQADIKDKKITFEEAAKQFSDDKSNAADGGALPWAGKGVFDPAFETAGFGIAKAGEVVGPVKSQFGYHLIKLVARGSEASAEEKAKYRKEQQDRIVQQSQNQQSVQMWFNTVLEKSKIVVNPTVDLVPAAKAPSATVFPAPAASSAKKTASAK